MEIEFPGFASKKRHSVFIAESALPTCSNFGWLFRYAKLWWVLKQNGPILSLVALFRFRHWGRNDGGSKSQPQPQN
jgi:hypothetical protein